MQPAITKRITSIILYLGVIALFSIVGVMVGVATVSSSFTEKEAIYGGVKVGGVDLGGLTIDEAQAKLSDVVSRRLEDSPITLVYKEQQWTIASQDIDLFIDTAELVNQAYGVGRNGHFLSRLQAKYVALYQGYNIPLVTSYNSTKLYDKLASIAHAIDKTPQNAKVVVVNKSDVSIVPEATGYKVNLAQLTSELTAKLNQTLPVIIHIPVEELLPQITSRDLDDINGLIASYTTEFNPYDENRSQNIVIAAEKINGLLIRQGEVFSFNTAVGQRIKEAGYKIAPVFINGKLTPDWGGGVCQVSSTLYNATLLADLEIVERTSHIHPPGYVPMGQDATVADDQLDFRFKNTSHSPLYIASEISGTRLTISIFGRVSSSHPDIRIIGVDKKVFEPNTVINQDPALDLGKEQVENEGQKGFQITTVRVKYQNGKEASREILDTDYFPPEDRIVRVGIKTPNKAIK